MQLAYYLYYLKKEKGLDLAGILLFPKERKTELLELTPELEAEVKNKLNQLKHLLFSETPPPAKRIKYCAKCSYNEFCWA